MRPVRAYEAVVISAECAMGRWATPPPGKLGRLQFWQRSIWGFRRSVREGKHEAFANHCGHSGRVARCLRRQLERASGFELGGTEQGGEYRRRGSGFDKTPAAVTDRDGRDLSTERVRQSGER